MDASQRGSARPAVRAALLVMLLLPGCGRDADKPRIRYMRWGDAVELRSIRKAAEIFEERFDAKVEIVMFPWANYETKLKLMISADILPDVVLIDRNYLADIHDMDAILPVDRFIRDDATLDWEDLLFRQVVTFDDEVMGLPEHGGGLIMMFNRDIFRELNMPDPLQVYLENPDDWNLRTFENMARRITRDRNGDGRYDWYGASSWLWLMPLLTNFYIHGGDIVNEDNSRVTIDTPECLDAIRFLVALYHPVTDPATGGTLPPAIQDPAEGSVVPGASGFSFQAGNVGMAPIVSSVAIKDYLEDRYDFDWDIVPFPRGPEGFRVSGGGNPVCISRNARHPELAYEFCKLLCSKELQDLKIRDGVFFFPTRRSVLQSDIFLERFRDIHMHAETFVTCVSDECLMPFPTRARNIRRIFRELIHGINDCVLGFQTPEETVAKLQDVLAKALEEGRRHMRGEGVHKPAEMPP